MKRSPRLPLSLLAACSAAAVAVALVPSAGAAGAATTPKARARTAHAASGARPRFRDDRVLVRFKPGARAELRSRALGAAPMQPSPSAQAQSASDVEVVPVPKGHVATELQRLRADPSVAHAQPDYLYYADSVTPNDADYTAEWGLGSIRAPEAWTTTTGDGSGAGPVVAVLDSGVDYTHPDLAANVWTNVGGVAGCASGTHGFNAITGSCDPRDDNGHGTHVSGTIGAVGGNGIGVVGVNWRARIMGVKFLDSRGEGDDFAAIDAIDWIISAKAAGVNVRVINASWGGPGLDPILDDAIARAFNAGILFVAAAGNDGTNNDAAPVDPCNATHVVCVAATDSLGNLAWFSNTGPTKVDLAAPGQGIVSTWPGGGYQVEDGTSMATPHVSGAAALVLAAEPGLLVDQLTARLLASTDGSLGGQIAHGVLDVCKAVAGCGTVPAVSPTPPLDLAVHRVNGTAMVAWNAPASNGGNPITGYGVTGSNGYSVSPVGRSVTVTGLGTAGASVTFSVRAKSGGHSSDPGSVRAVMLGGGYTLDAFGGLHPFRVGSGHTPPPANGAPYWRGWPIARGVALLPSGSGGYVLDGWGGLHPFGVGSNPPPPAVGGPSWRGRDLARGVTMLADGSGGYVVDGYGGLHSFAVGASRMPGRPLAAAYWAGWDVVRGVAIVPIGVVTSGGYTVDAFGGLHPFAAGRGGPPPVTGGPYWRGWDVARGVAVTGDGHSGYVGDAFGGLHPFRLGAAAPLLGPTFYRVGADLARGPAL